MTAVTSTKPVGNAPWVDIAILVGSLIFTSVLAISALLLPQWRVLHVLQGSIYIVVVVLTRRQSTWGFGAGALIAAFWNSLVLFRSPIGRQAIESIFRGGPFNLGVLLQFIGACGHVLIIAACVVGFLQLGLARRHWGEFIGGGLLAIGFQLVMSFTIGPPEAAVHLKQAFGL